MPPSEPRRPRIGYVLKMYPRLSETFILGELLELERQGTELHVFSLRRSNDAHFHEALGRLRAPVTYLAEPTRLVHLWDRLRASHATLSETLPRNLAAVLAVEPGEAAQAIELAGAVSSRGIDHLHAHFGSMATTVTRLAARLAGVGYSFTAHAKDIFHDEVDGGQLSEKLRDAAAVVTVSDYNLTFLRSRFGSAADRVVRIYNGLDLDLFEPGTPLDRPPRVIGVGRLVEKKGFDYLLDAIALLVDSGRDIHLDLVGGGVEESALRAQRATLGLTGHVRFHGSLTQEQTRDLVRGAAVLAAPCVVGKDGDRDGLPTVLLEAMALGTPVVSTPVTGIPEAVMDGRTGLLVPERDPRALAHAIARLVDDPALRCTLAAAARRHVEVNFDSRRNAAALHRLITGAMLRENGPLRPEPVIV